MVNLKVLTVVMKVKQQEVKVKGEAGKGEG